MMKISVKFVSRLLISLIFLGAGVSHVVNPESIIEKLLKSPMGVYLDNVLPMKIFIIASGPLMTLSALALIFGYQEKWAARMLGFVLIGITLTSQFGTGDNGPLFKNIAIFGALLIYAFPEESAKGLN